MRCPKCSGELAPVRVGSLEVEQCDRCGGYWFDRDELNELLDAEVGTTLVRPDGTPAPRLDRRHGACPRCDATLQRRDTLGDDELAYDECATCGGIWLDGGELEAIQDDASLATVIRFFTGA